MGDTLYLREPIHLPRINGKAFNGHMGKKKLGTQNKRVRRQYMSRASRKCTVWDLNEYLKTLMLTSSKNKKKQKKLSNARFKM